LFISNPATRTWLPIPLPEQLQPINVDLDIKVVLECDDDDKHDCMVFIFYDNSDEIWSTYLDCKVYV